MTKSRLLSTLSKVTKKATFFGPQGFIIATTANELETAQRGFSVKPVGAELPTFNVGNWNKAWIVIARDTELGDPYFVDINDNDFPVYTAIHVAGLWQPEPVASSLDSFLKCLALLSEKGQQECAQFVPNDATIEDKNQLTQLSHSLVKTSGCESFWLLFFECYLDWLKDEDS